MADDKTPVQRPSTNFKFRSFKNGVESVILIKQDPNDPSKGIVERDLNHYPTKADLKLKEDSENKVTTRKYPQIDKNLPIFASDDAYPSMKFLKDYTMNINDSFIAFYGGQKNAMEGAMANTTFDQLKSWYESSSEGQYNKDKTDRTIFCYFDFIGENEAPLKGYALLSYANVDSAKRNGNRFEFSAVFPYDEDLGSPERPKNRLLTLTCMPDPENTVTKTKWVEDWDVVLTLKTFNDLVNVKGVWG